MKDLKYQVKIMADGTLKVGTITTSSGSGTITLGQSGETVDMTNGSITLNSDMKNTPAFRAYMGATQTISDNTNTVVQYNTENFDTDSAYDTSTYRFTVPSGKAGKYFFSAHAYIFQSGATLYACDFQIRKNGTNQSADSLALDSSDNFSYIVKTNTILDLAVSDYIDCNVIGNTNDGGTLSVFTTSPYQFGVFQGFKLT